MLRWHGLHAVLIVLDLLTQALIPRPKVTLVLLSILILKFVKSLNRFGIVPFLNLMMISLVETGHLDEDRGLGRHWGRSLQRFNPTGRVLRQTIFEKLFPSI